MTKPSIAPEKEREIRDASYKLLEKKRDALEALHMSCMDDEILCSAKQYLREHLNHKVFLRTWGWALLEDEI